MRCGLRVASPGARGGVDMGRESRVPRDTPKTVKKRRPDFYVPVYPIKLRRKVRPIVQALDVSRSSS